MVAIIHELTESAYGWIVHAPIRAQGHQSPEMYRLTTYAVE